MPSWYGRSPPEGSIAARCPLTRTRPRGHYLPGGDRQQMRLLIEWSDITTVVAGAGTQLDGRTLEIDLDALRAQLEADPRLQRVRIDLAHPGESCRIGRVFDVFAPRAKLEGGEDFPGVLGALGRAGSGRTRALANVAVVVTDQQVENGSALALIDMAGPGAELGAFGPHRQPRALGVALGGHRALRVSRRRPPRRPEGRRCLARAASDIAPDRVEVFDLPATDARARRRARLPRVAYVFQIHSHQRPTGIDEGILYGDPVRRMLPTLAHPNEILDGAVMRGFMGRNVTTYATQNHPVIRALYAQHGRTLWFVGVVLTVAHATEPERVRSAAMAAGLVADVLGADGALFTKIGGGAPHVDMAQAAAQCEALRRQDRPDRGGHVHRRQQEGMLLFNFPGLDALVNVGSAQEPLALPPMARVVGADDLAPRLCGEISTTYAGLAGAIEQTGASRLVARIQ